jgi:ABC-type bacteriocin/lantibiotic exporter with double-glycine peptidase domain
MKPGPGRIVRGRKAGAAALAILTLALAARATAAPTAAAVLIDGVPFFPQETNGCGPAALASLLAFHGRPVELGALTTELVHPALRGTLPLDLEQAARRRGFQTEVSAGDLDGLRAAVRAGRPVIAFLNLGTALAPRGHFVVVVGFDDMHRRLLLHSGLDPYVEHEYARFLTDWKKTQNWQMAITPAAAPA